MSCNRNLTRARLVRFDEFYTSRATIEAEIQHYEPHFRGATVFCNCDDPLRSHFPAFFRDNFQRLGLKKLYVTEWIDQQFDFFGPAPRRPIGIEYDAQNCTSQALRGDGDFRSQECIDILRQADIVVTNPPFSLFREYLAQIMDYGKKFLIISNFNAVKYKDIFPLILANSIWTGVSQRGMEFEVPAEYAGQVSRIDPAGKKYRTTNAVWLTNMDYPRRYVDLELTRTYSPESYPRYDNEDAIEVSEVKDIPMDYPGPMGVPCTFLDRHNPRQFRLMRTCRPTLAGRETYERFIIYNLRPARAPIPSALPLGNARTATG